MPRGWLQKCEEFLDQFDPIIQEYHTLLTTNAIFVKRTAGIGIISPEMAVSFGTSGPVLRGSGIDHDLRRGGPGVLHEHPQADAERRRRGTHHAGELPTTDHCHHGCRHERRA